MVSSVNPLKNCFACGHENSPKRCGQCQVAFYCGETCQKKDWHVHRELCVIVSKDKKTQEMKNLVSEIDQAIGKMKALIDANNFGDQDSELQTTQLLDATEKKLKRCYELALIVSEFKPQLEEKSSSIGVLFMGVINTILNKTLTQTNFLNSHNVSQFFLAARLFPRAYDAYRKHLKIWSAELPEDIVAAVRETSEMVERFRSQCRIPATAAPIA